MTPLIDRIRAKGPTGMPNSDLERDEFPELSRLKGLVRREIRDKRQYWVAVGHDDEPSAPDPNYSSHYVLDRHAERAAERRAEQAQADAENEAEARQEAKRDNRMGV